MFPKRKLIKKLKSRSIPKTAIEQTQIDSQQSMLDRLKSSNSSVKEEAITILANLHCVLPQFSQPQFIRELISVLYQSAASLCHEALFAMANLCELEPRLIGRLFQSGLDKALVSLPSSSDELLKPILIFFITVCQNLPQKYHYLLQGIRASITPHHLSKNSQLCLQFFARTSTITTKKLSPQIVKQIASIYQNTSKIIQKSYAIVVMVRQVYPSKQMEEMLVNYMTEMLVCVDLEKEYVMNFGGVINSISSEKGQLLNQLEQQVNQQEQMEIENKHNTKQHSFSSVDQEKLKYFIATVNAIEILLEFLLDVLEKDAAAEQFQEEEEIQQEQDEIMQQQQHKAQNHSHINTQLSQVILTFTKQNISIFPKFLSLSPTSVPNTQNIVYLFYHLLLHIDKNIASTPSVQKQINQLVQQSLQKLFSSVQMQRKSQESLSYEQYEVLVQCLEIGLGVLLKNKAVGVGEDFLLNFSKSYMLDPAIFTSSKLLEQIKPSWLIMLQLYSQKLNPQKNQNITYQQNFILGEILKHLLISLPYLQLQQFRCQVIDTLFDVYSNQKFDETFVKLQFIQLLKTIEKQGLSSKQSKSKANKNKKKKFVLDVLNDVKRFISYKVSMIKKF